MDPFTTAQPTRPPVLDAPAAAGWESLVRSMESSLDGVADLKIIGVALAVVLVLWFNIRLARWIARRARRP